MADKSSQSSTILKITYTDYINARDPQIGDRRRDFAYNRDLANEQSSDTCLKKKTFSPSLEKRGTIPVSKDNIKGTDAIHVLGANNIKSYGSRKSRNGLNKSRYNSR